jgi:uncharacterized protein with PQ loop repeat
MVILVIITIYNIDKKIIIIEQIMEIWSLKNNNKIKLTIYWSLKIDTFFPFTKHCLNSKKE